MRNSTSKLMFSLLLLLISFLGFAQEKLIKGKLTDDETKESLPGVNILVKGTNLGTTTDANGDFQLSVSGDGVVLVCSFIGYITVEVPVGSNQTSFNISLSQDIRALEEVVVVGYGTQRKVDLTGAVGGLRASDIDIASKPVTSPATRPAKS